MFKEIVVQTKYHILISCLFASKCDLHGFKIRDNRGNVIVDDALGIKVISIYDEYEEEEINLYVDEDIKVAPLKWKMPWCYWGKPNNGRPTHAKYFASYDDNDEVRKSNKIVFLLEINDLDYEDVNGLINEVGGSYVGVGVGNGVIVGASVGHGGGGVGVGVDHVIVKVLVMILVWVVMWIYEEDSKKEDHDYITFEEDEFEFANEVKDDWIDNLAGDGFNVKNVHGASDSENKWKVSSDDDNVAVFEKFDNDSSYEFVVDDILYKLNIYFL